jgi:hypothetical protein
MSNNNQPDTQTSSNMSPVFTVPPPPFIASVPPPPTPAFYQSYAASMYAFHQQQFFQQMFSMPPPSVPVPPLPTSNIPNRLPASPRPPLPIDNTQRRPMGKSFFFLSLFFCNNLNKDKRQSSNSNSDYQDRKRNFCPSSLSRDTNKAIGNKRLYHSDQSFRNDDRNNQRREPPLSPVSKKRRISNNIIEDEYHEYENSFV